MARHLGLAGLVVCLAAAPSVAADAVKYDVHSGYFVKNTVKLANNPDHLALTDDAQFTNHFGVAVVMRDTARRLPRDAFRTRMVLAVVTEGDALTDYKVEKVTAEKDALKIEYKTETRKAGGSATYRSPMIVSVPKKDYKTVE